MEPCRLIGRRVAINERRFYALADLVASEGQFRCFVDSVFDPRFSRREWRKTIRRELLILKAWTLRRLVIAGRRRRSDSRAPITDTAPRRVLALLPGYGYAIHALRRAAPFTLLDAPVDWSVPPECSRQARSVLDVVAKTMRLGRSFRYQVRPSLLTKDWIDDRGYSLVVLTGRRESADALMAGAQGSHASVLAATGSGAVLLSPSAHRGELRRAWSLLLKTGPEPSCSRPCAAYMYEPPLRARSILTELAPVPSALGLAAETLRLLHPSVVYVLKDRPTRDVMGGYRVIGLDTGTLMPAALDGFGIDPVFGWPGDYLM